MKTSTKVVSTALGFTIVGLLLAPPAPLGRLLWPLAHDGPAPVGAQIPLLVGVSLLDALALGVGVAFLVFGRRALARVAPGERRLASAAHLAITWLFVSWVPHDSLHMSNGSDLWGIIRIDYGFHGTLLVASGVVAWFFVRVLAARAEPRAAEARTAPARVRP